MAGSYPDVPGYRFAYDIDGTGVVLSSGVFLGSTAIRSLNADQSTFNQELNVTFIFLFPEIRNISGIFISRLNAQPTSMEWSSDTISGVDGTWHNYGNMPSSSSSKISVRSAIQSVSLTNVKGVRFTIGSSNRLHNIHFYGSVEPDQSPNRLRIVDMSDTSVTSDGGTQTGEDVAAQLDFGNILQRNLVTRQFKVVNNSASQTANNITVSLDAPTDASPSLIGQYQISTDNVSFANAVNIGNLAPGADSGTLYLRNNVASNAQLSVWSARILAQSTNWT